MTDSQTNHPAPDLRGLARSADQSTWKADPHGLYVWADHPEKGPWPILDIRGWGFLTGKGHGALGLPKEVAIQLQRQVCDYVAAANPAAILSLLDEREALRADVERLTGERFTVDPETGDEIAWHELYASERSKARFHSRRAEAAEAQVAKLAEERNRYAAGVVALAEWIEEDVGAELPCAELIVDDARALRTALAEVIPFSLS